MVDTRYPYTYAADYIRSLAGYGEGGTKLSRSDSSKILSGIADAIGMTDNELAEKLADYYQENQESIDNKSVEEFRRLTDFYRINYSYD